MAVPFTIDLSGKVAVVTGGGGILCGRMAEALADCGASVAVLDYSEEKLAIQVERIVAAGGKAMGVWADIMDADGLKDAAARVRQEMGPCDLLVNGAGGNSPKATTSVETLEPALLTGPATDATTFFDLTQSGFEAVFGVNLIGTLLATQAFSRDMAAQGGGAIINISSMAAMTPLTKVPAYSAAKAALSNFTRWLAVHLAPCQVRVNAIAPGFFLTEQNRTLLTTPDGSITERGQKILRNTPMRRFGHPDELLGALLWLAGDGASFVNGTVIPIDGGFSAFSGV